LYLVLAKGLDLFVGSGLLAAEIVGGEPENRESPVLVLFVERLETGYCGVNPQRLATLTISTTLPWYAERGAGFPSIELR